MSETPQPSRRALLTALLAGGAAAAGFFLWMTWIGSGAYSRDPRLNRAALAVVGGQSRRSRQAVVRTPSGPVALPVTPRFERRRGVRLALEVARLRRTRAAEAPLLRSRMEEYLKIETRRAQVVLCALGLPGVAAPGTRRNVSDTPCRLVRQRVAAAFGSPAGMDRAAGTLERHAALVPAQARAVISMWGAVTLLEAGEEALPVVRAMAADAPEAARLLRRGIRRDGSAGN